MRSSHHAPTKRWSPPPPSAGERVYEERKALLIERMKNAIADLRAAEAAGEGDDDKTAALEAAIERYDRQLDRLVEDRSKAIEGAKMTTAATNYANVTKAVTDGPLALARKLVAFDADAAEGKYPAEYVESTRKAMIGAIRVADGNAQLAFQDYREAAILEARNLRIKADAEVDPARRVAEMTETKMLIESRMTAGDLLAKAREFVVAGYPAKAAVYADAATAKGASGIDLNPITRAIDEGLDKTDPSRAMARDIEDGIEANLGDFATSRARILAASGVGMKVDGSTGLGEPGQAAVANIEAKTAAAMTAWGKGETFAGVVGDGTNTEAENAELHRIASRRASYSE
jgi:hypothetical protein